MQRFGELYCMRTDKWEGLLLRAPSGDLCRYIEALERAILGAGLLHIRLPRGAGKTTWAKIGMLWAVSTGRLRYPVCFAATDRLAAAILDDVWRIMEQSEPVAQDWPEIAHPVRCLDGKWQRAPSQTLDGTRTAIRRTHDTISFPVVEGAASSGALISARGAGSAVRGLVKGSMRPDFTLMDDIQTREDARSARTTGHLSEWVAGDVLGLGGARQLSSVMTSTPICDGDLSAIFADAALSPAWRSITLPLVQRWPQGADEAWEHYAELWRAAMADGDSEATVATEYYRSRREIMDAGAVILDPGGFDGRMEISALQHAVNLRLRIGENAFQAEYQLVPPKLASVISVSAKQVAACCNGGDRGVMPAGTMIPLAAIDIMADAGLVWAVGAFGPHQTAAVIDYGRVPERGRLVPESVPERELHRIVAGAMVQLLDRLLNSAYPRADGQGTARLQAIWIDHGWLTRVVVRLASMYRGRGYPNVWTAKGWSSPDYKDGVGKNVMARGWQSDMREREGVRFAGFNADYWKEGVQRAFLGQPMQPGTLSWWGRPTMHGEVAEQVAAEVLNDKAVSARGQEMYRWTRRPGAENHMLDALAILLAAASWHRVWDVAEGAAAAVAPVGASGSRGVRPAPGGRAGGRRWRSAKAHA